MKHIATQFQFLLESKRNNIVYRPDGSVQWEEWLENGKLHRLDGPAWIEYRPDGSVESEKWWENGKRHRLDGPAQIGYRPDGSVESEKWYRNDSKLGEEEVRELKRAAVRKELKSLGFSDADIEIIAPIF